MKIKRFLVCKLFRHRPMKFVRYLFHDNIARRNVGLFKCKYCNKQFMAFSGWSIFRVNINKEEVRDERD